MLRSGKVEPRSSALIKLLTIPFDLTDKARTLSPPPQGFAQPRAVFEILGQSLLDQMGDPLRVAQFLKRFKHLYSSDSRTFLRYRYPAGHTNSISKVDREDDEEPHPHAGTRAYYKYVEESDEEATKVYR